MRIPSQTTGPDATSGSEVWRPSYRDDNLSFFSLAWRYLPLNLLGSAHRVASSMAFSHPTRTVRTASSNVSPAAGRYSSYEPRSWRSVQSGDSSSSWRTFSLFFAFCSLTLGSLTLSMMDIGSPQESLLQKRDYQQLINLVPHPGGNDLAVHLLRGSLLAVHGEQQPDRDVEEPLILLQIGQDEFPVLCSERSEFPSVELALLHLALRVPHINSAS